MKKKGFTLVELLAVIAILAILVIIALPNVLGMFNRAKKNTFVTELQSIYDTGSTQFVSDAMGDMSKWTDGVSYGRAGGKSAFPSNVTGTDAKGVWRALDLSGTTSIDYFIHFNLAGKVTEFYASDGQYQFAYCGPELEKQGIISQEITREGAPSEGLKLYAIKGENDEETSINWVKSGSNCTASTGHINTGVITIADAMTYATNWQKVNFSYDNDKNEVAVQLVKYNKSSLESGN